MIGIFELLSGLNKRGAYTLPAILLMSFIKLPFSFLDVSAESNCCVAKSDDVLSEELFPQLVNSKSPGNRDRVKYFFLVGIRLVI